MCGARAGGGCVELPEWNCHDWLAGATDFPGISRARACIPASRAAVSCMQILYDMHEFYCTAHVLVVGPNSIPGGGSLLAFRLPARVYRWGGRVGVSTLEIQVLS